LSGTLKSSGEILIDHLGFPVIDLYVPALTSQIHCSNFALQFAENTTFVFPFCINTGIVHEQNGIPGAMGSSFIVDHRILGQRRYLEEFLPLFFLA
jgi:hypothetical protein